MLEKLLWLIWGCLKNLFTCSDILGRFGRLESFRGLFRLIRENREYVKIEILRMSSRDGERLFRKV